MRVKVSGIFIIFQYLSFLFYLFISLFICFYFLQLFGLLKTELMRSFYTILKKTHNLKIKGICLVVLIIYNAKKTAR